MDNSAASTLSAKKRQLLLKKLKQKAQQKASSTPALKRVEQRPEHIPLSFAQQRLWFVSQLDKSAGAAYHLPAAMRLKGKLDIESLSAALDSVVAKHEVLRTTIYLHEGAPFQRIAEKNQVFSLSITDLTHLSESERESVISSMAQQEVEKPFDMEKGPLIRGELIKVSNDQHVLLITQHHIISDGWSIGIFINEVAAAYEALASNRGASLSELEVQYADYAIWQRNWLQGEQYEKHLNFWHKYLNDSPEVIDLPADRARPDIQSYAGSAHELVINGALTKKLRAFSQRHGLSLFMTMYAAWSLFLSKLTNQNDVVVGTPVSNRNKKQLEQLIGFFTNTLALRVKVDKSLSINAFVAEIKQSALKAFEHQHIPFEQIVEAVQPTRSMSYSPVFQVMLSLNNTPKGTELDMSGLHMEMIAQEQTNSQYDLSLDLNDVGEQIVGSMQYAKDLFNKDTIELYGRRFVAMLENFVDCEEESSINTISILDSNEKEHILGELANGIEIDVEPQLVHQTIEQMAHNYPSKVAVKTNGDTLTFAELAEKANKLACYLQSNVQSKGARIALCLERDVDMVVSMLAVLKSGASFIPMDPSYPKERLQFMLDDAKPACIISREKIFQTLTTECPFSIDLDDQEQLSKIAASNSSAIGSDVVLDDVAYVIYTSGSTGNPKGVLVSHRNLNHLVTGHKEATALSQNDVVLQFASCSFDVSIGEIFPALSIGAQIVLRPSEIVAPTPEFVEFIQHNNITVVDLPTAFWHQWTQELAVNPSLIPSNLRLVIVGGEKVEKHYLDLWLESTKGLDIEWIDAYGPTEATVTATYFNARQWNDGMTDIPIGRPIANTQAYVLENDLVPVAAGVTGELYIGGDGVALGYLDRENLTAEKFINNPFGAGKLYKTGDLVKFRADGLLEYKGRNDDQVKIRGYRIELGEIEAKIAGCSGVQQAFVTAFGSNKESKRLVGYYTSQSTATDEVSVYEELSNALASFMLPSALMRVDSFPLTPNGKVDIKALPAPDFSRLSAQEYIAPETASELKLADIWSGLLNIERVSRHDNFFKLGGHSLLAVQMVSKIKADLGLEVAVKDVFASPTLAGLSQCLEQAKSATQEVIAIAERSKTIPTSFAQQRLWFVSQLDQSSGGAYHMPAGLMINGEIDKSALQLTLDTMIARHESLRTTFKEQDGVPVQVIAAPSVSFQLETASVTAIAAEQQQQQIEAICQEMIERPFDLESGPLIRGVLIEQSDTEHALMIVQHHIITDGWSINIFVKEVSELYDAFHQGQSNPLDPLSVQYADFAVWQRQKLSDGGINDQRSFWKRYLEDSPEVMHLPTDRPRTEVRTYLGDSVDLTVSKSTTSKLKAIASKHETTLFMTMFAAWAAFLSKVSGQSDMVIGTPVANRQHQDLESLIGFFVNTLALRVKIEGNPTLGELLQLIKRDTVEAYQHQDIPFEQVVEAVQPARSMSYTPLFQVIFNWESMQSGSNMDLSGLSITPLASSNNNTQFDLTLFMKDTGDLIIGSWRFAKDLFDKDTIESMSRNFEAFLQQLAYADDKPLSQLTAVAACERVKILERFNANLESPKTRDLLHIQFEKAANEWPQKTAVICESSTIDYHTLNSRANQLARFLNEQGIQAGDIVALRFEHSVEMCVAILAALKSGAAYMPIDLNSPLDRVEFMLQDSQCKLVLSHETANDGLASNVPVFCIDQLEGELSQYQTSNLGVIENLNESSPAYVIYTSGSTGDAKGVVVRHQSPVNFSKVLEQEIYHDSAQSDVVALNASYAFDMSLKGILQLFVGRTLVLIPQTIKADGERLVRFLAHHQVSGVDCTPSQLSVLLDRGLMEQESYSPKKVLIGGEAISSKLWNRINQYTKTDFYNMYGPTECTIDVTIGLIESSKSRPHIGRPVRNMQVHILDENQQMVPAGVAGEIWVCGTGVAEGYLHRKELTSAKFYEHGLAGITSSKLYRTGDIGKWNQDGTIEYIGRNDDQIKIRGYRIEIGEIEGHLNKLSNVEKALVMVREDIEDDKSIVAYLQMNDGGKPDPLALKNYLVNLVPHYMVPKAFVGVSKFQLNKNGKLDKLVLPKPDESSLAKQTYIAPETEAEIQVASIWTELLDVEQVGKKDSFFDLGGHSLLGILLLSKVKQKMAANVSLRLLFENPRLSDFAAAIENVSEQVRFENLVTIKQQGSLPPLFLIHPSEGEVAYAFEMAPYLDQNRPVYALAASGLEEGTEVHDSVEEMAKAYIQQIRQVQPEGPYNIAGWSAGGTIAYEMAYQLIGLDQEISFLGLFDTSSDYQSLRSQFESQCQGDISQLKFIDWMNSLAFLPHNIASEDRATAIGFLRNKNFQGLIEFCQHKLILPQGVEPELIKRHMHLRFNMAVSLAKYNKPSLPITLQVFGANEEDRTQRPLDWQKNNQAEIHRVAGDHFSMMQGENIVSLAECVEEQLNTKAKTQSALAELAYNPVIPIQAGSKFEAPIYCIPGAGASVTTYASLAQALGQDYPVIGLQPRGLCGDLVPHNNIQAAAKFYCDAILKSTNHKNIKLIGHSYGGWVAVELAKQLQKNHIEVSFLAALDSPAPYSESDSVDSNSDIQMLMRLVEIYEMSTPKSLGLSEHSFKGKTYQAQVSLLLQKIIEVGLVPKMTQLSMFKGVVDVFKANINAPYQTDTVLNGTLETVHVPGVNQNESQAENEINSIQKGWSNQATHVNSWVGPGNHMTLLAAPHVNHLATYLKQQMGK